MNRKNSDTLAGKTALVIGATSGIGRAVADTYSAAGALVVLAGRRADLGMQAVCEIKAAGGEAEYLNVDVTDGASVERAIRTLIAKHGALDIAFNAAGTVGKGAVPFQEVSDQEWRHITETNLTGTWNCLRYQAAAMLSQRSGCIINCSSVLGLTEGGAYPGMAPYSAAKYGIVGLTKTLASEVASSGVRVNAICPGFVETDMLESLLGKRKITLATRHYPMRRSGRPAEIASVALFLASEASCFITGQAIAVDGGYTVR